MRITTISSSFASTVVVVVATACVAFAGIAVRSFLHRTSMRDCLGYWLELCQSGSDAGCDQHGQHFSGYGMSGYKPGLLLRYGISALALCPAPSRMVAVRTNWQG